MQEVSEELNESDPCSLEEESQRSNVNSPSIILSECDELPEMT